MAKVFIIDPFAETITEKVIGDFCPSDQAFYTEVQEEIGRPWGETVATDIACSFTFDRNTEGDCIFVEDGGNYRQKKAGFFYGEKGPWYGIGAVVGFHLDGDSADAAHTIEELKEKIVWC